MDFHLVFFSASVCKGFLRNEDVVICHYPHKTGKLKALAEPAASFLFRYIYTSFHPNSYIIFFFMLLVAMNVRIYIFK